jgi:hypothetical protein
MEIDDFELELAAAAAAAADEQSTGAALPSAAQQAQEMGFTNFIAKYHDGQILENPQTGERVFVSPGYNITNPETISNMMQGTSPAETGSAQIQEQIIEKYPVASRAATALQGVPFIGSYTDEAVGMFNPQAGEAMRQSVEAVRSQRPGQATALEIGGAIAATPALIAAAPTAIAPFVTGATSLFGKMFRGALVGTGAGTLEGTVSGYGRGEGEDRLREAGAGAELGAGLGFVTGGLLPGASAAIRAGWENIKGRSVGQIAQTLRISTDAAKVVRTALENDDLVAAAAALDRAGSSSMLADAGPATQQLLDVTVTSGGSAPRVARQAVETRAEQAAKRMTTVLDDVLGPPEGVLTTQRGIRQGTQEARNRAYRVAYAQPIDYSRGRGRYLESLLKRVPQSAIKQANELMRLEGVKSAQILAEVAKNGAVSFKKLPDVRQLDYITRAMGDVAEQQNALGKLGGTTQLGRATANLQRDIRKVLKAEVPQYGDALDVAADAISRVKATEAGADIINKPNMTMEAVKDFFRGTSKAERNAAKAGLRSALDEKLARVKAVATDQNIDIREFRILTQDFSSRSMINKLNTLLGEQEANILIKELNENITSLELRAVIARNSATAQRIATKSAVEDITSPNALQMLVGEGPDAGPVNATKRLVAVITGTTKEARALRQMGMYDEIANTLVSLRGSQAKLALELVEKAMAGDALNETQARIIARALTTPAAMATYGFVTAEAQQ